MKTMDEVVQLLARQVPSDPAVRLLNEAFGHLGWEYDGYVLKAMVKVSEGHFLSVSRCGDNLTSSAAQFGLEVKNEEPKQPPAPEPREEPSVQAPLQPRPSRKVIEESISAASRICIEKKLRTQSDLEAMLGAYGVKSKGQLNDEQALKLLEQLKAILK